MFFSQLELQPRASQQKEFWRLLDDPYRLHQHIWEAFPANPDKDRDFLYHLEQRGGRTKVMVVSKRKPLRASKLWIVKTKPYNPTLRKQQRLRFLLRANPVKKKNGKRHDVIMYAKTHLRQTGGALPGSQAELVQEEGEKWLAARAERLGFHLHGLQVDGYNQMKMRNRGRRICISSCDFQGVLEVADPTAMHRTLLQGVGHAKAFGCGLLMVKPL